ncbi:MAG: DUF1846 family protein [Methanobacteriota archaeon]|nr:MAG: DUF1846 family protein [Euryarchaeota archaeon]
MKIPFKGSYGFNNSKYVDAQSKAIISRAEKFHKLYLEFGGKLLQDFHAARVLPGYESNAKIEVLRKLKKVKDIEFLLCINSDYIEEGKFSSVGLSYRDFSLKMVDSLREMGFDVKTAVFTFNKGQKKVKELAKIMKRKGLSVYYTPYIKGYPKNVAEITSVRGFRKRPFIKTTKRVVVVTGAGPTSGKMATCLTMVYQDYVRGKDSGYAKFETFPIWNLPLSSNINGAYEAATADLGDYNVVDGYHKKAYGFAATSYNRDFEAFSLLTRIIRLLPESNYMHSYKSPTDMGINMAKEGITDEELCERAARQEIIRRLFKYRVGLLKGKNGEDAVIRVRKLMRNRKIAINERQVVEIARKEKKKSVVKPAVGCSLEVGKTVVKARNSKRMHAEAGAIIKALKKLAGAKKDVLDEDAIRSIRKLRKEIYGKVGENLTLKEALLVLAMSSAKNRKAKKAMDMLNELRGAELHTTHMISEEEDRFFLRLGINATSDGEEEVKEVLF